MPCQAISIEEKLIQQLHPTYINMVGNQYLFHLALTMWKLDHMHRLFLAKSVKCLICKENLKLGIKTNRVVLRTTRSHASSHHVRMALWPKMGYDDGEMYWEITALQMILGDGVRVKA